MIIVYLFFHLITQVFFFELTAQSSSLDDVISAIEKQVIPNQRHKGQNKSSEITKNKYDDRKTVCTKSFRSNFRKGPGINFPIEYEILRSGYPLKVIKNVDTWYAVEDFEGRIAWLGSINVRSKCGAIISKGGFTSIYFAPSTKSKILFSVEKGYIINELECQTAKWCLVTIQNTTGWILKNDIWGNI